MSILHALAAYHNRSVGCALEMLTLMVTAEILGVLMS